VGGRLRSGGDCYAAEIDTELCFMLSDDIERFGDGFEGKIKP
jgi:hypothetical protein